MGCSYRGGVTPVPIPNTEVKPSSADGTALETGWESRALPGVKKAPGRMTRGFIVSLSRLERSAYLVIADLCPELGAAALDSADAADGHHGAAPAYPREAHVDPVDILSGPHGAPAGPGGSLEGRP